MFKSWIKMLENISKEYMDDGYTVDCAMAEAWNRCYSRIVEDFNVWDLSIGVLRNEFWDNSFPSLELYEEDIIKNADRFPCKDCDWFTWDHISQIGSCFNYNVNRSKDSKCFDSEE